MTKQEIFNYFYTNNANLGVKAIGITMIAGLIIGLVIFATYYLTYRGVAYNVKFNTSLLIILLISVVIMMMISSNIVISLGMVGALSIVRFRTAIKDSRDTVFIFWAIAEGLCVGSGNFKLAAVTSLFVAVVVLGSNFIWGIGHKYLLIIRNNGQLIDSEEVIKQIKPFVVGCRMRTASREKKNQEFIFEIRTNGEIDLKLIDMLQEVEGVQSVNWVSEAGDVVG